MDYNQNNYQNNGYQNNGYQPQQYEQPQYNAPQYEQPQYNAPQYEQPQYNAPQYGAPQYEQPQYGAQPNAYAPVTEKDESKGMGIAALVAGILSVTCCCGSFIPSILAVVFGIISKNKKKENNGLALAGIILGAIGIVLSVIWIIYIIAVGGIAAMAEGFNVDSYYYY